MATYRERPAPTRCVTDGDERTTFELSREQLQCGEKMHEHTLRSHVAEPKCNRGGASRRRQVKGGVRNPNHASI